MVGARSVNVMNTTTTTTTLQEGERYNAVAYGWGAEVHGRVEEDGRTSVLNAPGSCCCEDLID